MQYFIYLGSLKILLPSEYSLQERIDYVDDLITSHEQYFRFLLASTKENYAADLVEHRLSCLLYTSGANVLYIVLHLISCTSFAMCAYFCTMDFTSMYCPLLYPLGKLFIAFLSSLFLIPVVVCFSV